MMYASTPRESTRCTETALERAETQPVTEPEQRLGLAFVQIPAPANVYATLVCKTFMHAKFAIHQRMINDRTGMCARRRC